MKNPVELKPTKKLQKESKEEAFHRIMDRHFKQLANRYRLMRKTLNSHRPSQVDADLLSTAVSDLSEKFINVVKSRMEDEAEIQSIWQ